VILPDSTRMFREAAEGPAAVREQLTRNQAVIEEAAEVLRTRAPRVVVTCARGSSDHAATFAKYLIETRAGVLTSSAAPSVSSVYAATADMNGAVFLAISQSGASPDLLATTEAAREAGAFVLALVNAEASPLARAAHLTIPLRAGVERSVAATKSYIASLAAVVHLVSAWTRDRGMFEALAAAPDHLERAWQLDWGPAAAVLQPASGLFVVGRGLGLGAAQEAALKLKETCGLHAEAFSSAEVRHGPMALVGEGFPVLLFAQSDETRAGIEELAADLVKRGAIVLLADAHVTASTTRRLMALPAVGADAVIEPMLRVQSFYRMANALSIARGRDPDRPPHLHKVTETL
jgi:glutamine---fructose-6-phosphate transaminase (isomerizing)